MKSINKILFFLFSSAFVCLIFHMNLSAQISFKISEEPLNLPGLTNVILTDVNDSDAIAGRSDSGHFIYKSGNVTVIPPLTGYQASDASGGVFLNNSNDVGGTFYKRGFLYKDGNLTGINNVTSVVNGINESGALCGYALLALKQVGMLIPFANQAFIYQNGDLKNLGIIGQDSSSYATGINNINWVVGASTISAYYGQNHAFIYRNDNMTDLGTLPGDFSAVAYAINDSGYVVGYSANAVAYKAVVWSSSGVINLLPVLDSATSSYAYGINNNKLIIGECNLSGGNVPAVWSNNKVYNINDLIKSNPGYAITQLVALNNLDDILALAIYNDTLRYVLLKKAETKEVFIVNTTGDESDADLSDGICDTDLDEPGNQCTLRAAIEQANHNPGSDRIIFDIPGTSNPVLQIESPLPVITETVEIDGTTLN